MFQRAAATTTPMNLLALARMHHQLRATQARQLSFFSGRSGPTRPSNAFSVGDREKTSPVPAVVRPMPSSDWEQTIPHPGYKLTAIEFVEPTHHEPSNIHDHAALLAVKAVRTGFDILSGYRGPGGVMTERDWLNRCVFLETVAGVPGMVAGMARHLRSLRGMRRDYGWIHTLLEEAENERMHLMIFVKMRQPGWLFRLGVLGAQGVFFNCFFWTYLISPRTCHRFVGYLEEEAVKTYTGLLQDISDGHFPTWKTQRPPQIARSYYNLADDATVVDLIACIRADEANHRDVNHTLADLKHNAVNPYAHDVTPSAAAELRENSSPL